MMIGARIGRQGMPKRGSKGEVTSKRAASAAANPFNTQYDVGTDGRFLVNLAIDDLASSPITLILNWRGTGR